MKNNNLTTFIIVAGSIVLSVFTLVLIVNIVPNLESNSYYVKVGDEMGAKIEALDFKGSKLNITTSGDAMEYCVKSTRSTPDVNSICWKNIEKNKAVVSVYNFKKYFVWIKDTNGNISNPMSINIDK
jgi:hypothetical protein